MPLTVVSGSLQSSSSDESDGDKTQPNFKFMKKPKHDMRKKIIDIRKRDSSDSGEVHTCGSSSDKETGASRDSDSSTSGSCYTLPPVKRKTPIKLNRSFENESLSNNPASDSESFLQDKSCSSLLKAGSRLTKCRECFKSTETSEYSCRFFSFRKLRWSKKGNLASAGFANPFDASEEEVNLWLPSLDDVIHDCQDLKTKHLDFHVARFILLHVGDQFCDLMRQETDAHNLHMGEDKIPAWKKPMKGVREMCDVCKTTLFNFHWACERCGFVVCIDCYKVRKSGDKKAWMTVGVDHDEWKWLNCTTSQPHSQQTLMLCQTIAKDCLNVLGKLVHDVRSMFGIPQECQCSNVSNAKPIPGPNAEVVNDLITHDPLDAIISHLEKEPGKVNDSTEHEARTILEAEKQTLPDDDSSSDSDEEELEPSLLRDQLFQTFSTPDIDLSNSSANKVKASRMDICQNVESTLEEISKNKEVKVMLHFIRSNQGSARVSHTKLLPRRMTNLESCVMYPNVPHSWLCDGMLLRLIDPSHSGNYRLFQDQWRRGQPIIVGNMTRLLNMSIWHPDSFCRDFGEKRNDLINCATGHLVPDRPMREFWEGFEHFSKRLKDDKGNPMLLKLKDWPPGEDFAELLPERFKDLMQALPLTEYTNRTGRLNLASWLPDFFVRPDLGPKMYNAYGSALFPTKGTTNLHLDISDAVNFMVYVGIPQDENSEDHIQEAFRAIDEAGCDVTTRRRVRIKGEMPGALWHIYHASDADKIRDLLNKVAIERGTRLEPHHDPIHDQSWYLDGELRERLYTEYKVEGYAIVQCLGDAVFIPAGAPHQVRNLHNCVKVAEDFVSPENVSQCFHLTQEFRDLSDTHTNHEDKLQIKNIIYHTIKNGISSLLRVVNISPDEFLNGVQTKCEIKTERDVKN